MGAPVETLRERLTADQAQALMSFRRLVDGQCRAISRYGDLPEAQRAGFIDELSTAFGPVGQLLRALCVDKRLVESEVIRSLELLYGRQDPRRFKIPRIANVFVEDLRRITPQVRPNGMLE